MTEKDFLDIIDCKFPYNNLEKWKDLIDAGLKISDTCIYWIIHELVRVPKSLKNKVKKSNLLYFIDYINNTFSWTLKTEIIDFSYKLINSQFIDKVEILVLMEKVKTSMQDSIFLNILYFSIDDIDGNIEKKYNEIIDYWNVNLK